MPASMEWASTSALRIQIEQKDRGRANLFSPLQLGNLFAPALTSALLVLRLWQKLNYPCLSWFSSFQKQIMGLFNLHSSFSSVPQSCPTLCNPMNHSTPGLPIHHQLLEFTQTYVHRVGDDIQPSHPLSSPSPPTFNLSQHQGLFQ